MKKKLEIPRGKTLFYTDAVNVLRSIFPVEDYCYRDDYNGDVIIERRPQLLISVEIKSEAEVQNVTTTTGETFKNLRDAINNISCLDGKGKGWLVHLAQCWFYMACGLPLELRTINYKEMIDILVIPANKEEEFSKSLLQLQSYSFPIAAPECAKLRYPSCNIAVFIYKHDTLTELFSKIA